MDLTSVQTLVDIKNALDKHAAPNPVQWHFACIHSQWTKRALSAAGFGFPSFESENGEPEHFKSIYSLAEMQDAAEPGHKSPRASQMNPEDVELGDMVSPGGKMVASRTEDRAAGSPKPAEAAPTANDGRPRNQQAVLPSRRSERAGERNGDGGAEARHSGGRRGGCEGARPDLQRREERAG